MNIQITAHSKLYIGIDIDKRSWKIHCSTDLFSGKSFSMEPDPVILQKYVLKHFPDYSILIFSVATALSQFLYKNIFFNFIQIYNFDILSQFFEKPGQLKYLYYF